MSVVLGIENARVVATLANRTFTYELPLTNRNGRQIETYEIKKIRHFTQGLDISTPTETILESVLGYRIYWDLSYSTFLDGDDVMNMVAILERYKQGYTLTLYPRADQDWRYFDVIPDNESLSLGISTGGYDGFNTDWNFKFVTRNLEQDLKLQIATEAPEIAYLINYYASI